MESQDRNAKQSGGMVRETFRHAAVYSGANMLGRLVGFIMLPFFAHILRDIGYGVIGMIDASLTLLSSLLGYSFRTAVIRIYHEEPDPERKRSVAPTATSLVAGILLPLVSLSVLFCRPISALLLGSSEYWHLIILAVTSFYLGMISETAQSILIIQRRSATYSLIGLGRLVVGLSLNILLVVILRWDLLGFFLGGLIAALLTLLVQLWLLRRICGFGFDRELARRLMVFQLPLIPGSIAQFFSRQVERVIVRYRIDLATVGILEMAYKFPVLLNFLVVTPFNQSWGTKSLEIADEADAPARIGQIFTYYLYLMLLGSLILSVNIQTVLKILTPPEFWPAYRITLIETLYVILRGAYVHLCFGILYAKKTAIFARMAMVSSALKVPLSYGMISAWGLYGAAWSGVIVAAIETVWAYLVGRRYYRLQIEWRKVGLIIGAAVVVFMVIHSLSTEAITAWGEPALIRSREIIGGLQGTWLGTVKDGKVITILSERSELVLDLIVRTLLVTSYLLIMPLVHFETNRKLRKRVATGVRRISQFRGS